MIENVDVVIGMNYGDEGKGHLVDYLASCSTKDVAVVRFNSGAQAGHTVEVGDNRHVFHSLGSGTFAGAPTILSRFFVVNFYLFFNEAVKLHSIIQKKVEVFVDPRCPVTTPFDVFLNQEIERKRCHNKHGSCGVGFGETLERESRGLSLTVSDLGGPDLESKLDDIEKYFHIRLDELGLQDLDLSLLKNARDIFTDIAQEFIQCVNIVNDTQAMALFNHIIFEGAQGLRLDQNSVDFPHVTRSNTGLKNVSELLSDIDTKINVYYLTRTYLTRHGAGPLKDEYIEPLCVDDSTNTPNEFQGTLRFAPINTNDIKQFVDNDIKNLDGRDYSLTAVITHCDQANAANVNNIDDLIKEIASAVGTDKVITSWGSDRHHIVDNRYVLC